MPARRIGREWFQEEWRIGYSEPGEHCTSHKGLLAPYTQVLLLRLRRDPALEDPAHPRAGLWGPPVERICTTCADLLDGIRDIQVGPRGGRLLPAASLDANAIDLTRQFWAGLRHEDGARR